MSPLSREKKNDHLSHLGFLFEESERIDDGQFKPKFKDFGQHQFNAARDSLREIQRECAEAETILSNLSTALSHCKSPVAKAALFREAQGHAIYSLNKIRRFVLSAIQRAGVHADYVPGEPEIGAPKGTRIKRKQEYDRTGKNE